MTRGEVLVLTGDAMVVHSRGRQVSYAWLDVLEVSWRAGGLGSRPGPVLRVRGGTFAQPGPNFPGQVAHLSVFGRRAGAHARARLRQAAEAHGVPYTEDLERVLAKGRRARLPVEG